MVIGQLKWACSEGTAYYVKCKDDLPEPVIDLEKDVMTVAQHHRIMDVVTERHKESDQEERRKAARARMVLHIADQLLSDPSYEMDGIDFDYETSMHDKIKALIAQRDMMLGLLKEVHADSGFANLFEPLQEKIHAAI